MSAQLLQTTLDGLLDGGAYALLGLGLTLTYGTLGRMNLAYGATAMLAAYVGAWLHARHGLGPAAVLPLVVAAAVAIGLYVEWLCFPPRDAGGSDRTGLLAQAAGVAALGASFALWMQLEQLAVGLLPLHLNPFPSLAADGQWALGPLLLRTDRLAVLGLAVLCTVALAGWLRHTRAGLGWRASADRPVAAHLAGIAVARVQRVAFATGCALSGLAACAVLSLDGQVTPMFGMWMLLKGLAAAMLGGLGSVPGVLAGGLLLGVAEAHAQAAAGALAREFATYALLFAMLVLAPSGRPARWATRRGRTSHAG